MAIKYLIAPLTTLTFDSERWDTDSMHSGSSSQIYCNTSGKYLIGCNIEWEDAGAGGERTVQLKLNGTYIISQVTDYWRCGGYCHCSKSIYGL